MEMRAGRTASGTSKADDRARADPIVIGDKDLGEMGIKCLEAILMTKDNQIAISLIILRQPDLTIESGIDRGTCLERQVSTLMATTVTVTKL